MSQDRLKELGFQVRETEFGLEADLSLEGAPLVNPLSHASIENVTFTVVGERVIAIEPPELVGIQPLLISAAARPEELREQISAAFNDHLHHLQRRSSELQSLSLSPRVDPASLSLTADLEAGSYAFVIASDRRGNFRVAEARKDGKPLDTSAGHLFELSEFRDRGALVSYLMALFGDVPSAPPATKPAPPPPLTYADLAGRIGAGARVPPTSPIEVLVEFRVKGQRYRFAAARVSGRTFRGLLAGAQGKLWAERFELDAFPGVRALAAAVLQIPEAEIEIVADEVRGG